MPRATASCGPRVPSTVPSYPRRGCAWTPSAFRPRRPQSGSPPSFRRHSGKPGEPARVGFAFLALGGMELLRLLAHVIEERGIAGQFLDSRLPVQFRVEPALQEPDREGA